MADYHRRNGRLGGLQTALRHGSDHFRKMGQVGGKHHKPTYEELATAAQINIKEDRLPTALPELKALFKQINVGTG